MFEVTKVRERGKKKVKTRLLASAADMWLIFFLLDFGLLNIEILNF